jgi:F0F1-type ATP synthase membrane subunit b/b'
MVLDPLAQIDLVAIGGVAAIFLATFLVLRRIFFGPLIEVMERRALRVETARARRAEAERLLEGARHQAEGILAAAREEAGRVADAMRQERIELSEGKRAAADAEAGAILARGREEVLALRSSEEARLAEGLCACVGQTLTRMVGHVDERTVRFLVNRALAAKEVR